MSHFSTSAGLYQTDVDYSNTILVRKSDNHCAFTILQAYLNQKRLDAEAKRLHTNAQEFAKQVCHSIYRQSPIFSSVTKTSLSQLYANIDLFYLS